MENLKVAIVGGGAIGLYLAWKLSEIGNQVTVFEKKEKIGKVACSGLFSKRILDFIPESLKLVENKINSVFIHFPKKTVKVHFSKEFFIISHFQLDNLLAELAERAGAKILLGHSIDSIPEGFDRVIGCDGPNSIIRRELSLKEPSFRLGIQGFVPKQDYSAFVETWPVDKGFIWKIPRGKETEYGIMASPETAKVLFNEFLIKNKLELNRLSSGLVPQGLLIPTNPSVTLCGDAAGLTKPWSGGGVVWGLIAARLLLKNFPDLLKYRNSLKKFFLPKIALSKAATKMVYFLGFNLPGFLPKEKRIESDFLF